MKINKQNAGWIVAIALGAVMAGSGFQATQEKTGVIDMGRVIRESELGKKNDSTLRVALAARQDLIEFVRTYKVLTTDQATLLKDLSLKPVQSEADKTKINQIRQDVIEADKKRNLLLQKTNATEADRLVLQDYNNRAQTMSEVLMQWGQEFQDTLDQMEANIQSTTIEKARKVVKDLGKAKGFTVVFESSYAVYGANDLTEDGIKALNAAPN